MDTNKIKKNPISKDEMKDSQEKFMKKYNIKKNPLICNFEKAELLKLLNKIDNEYVVFVIGDSLDPADKKKAIIYLRVPEEDKQTITYSYYPSNLCPPPRDCDLQNH
ncbi:MAG: hypothetical protein H0V91_07440 [Flavisolibacter sp.]|nr:hypothetical protein [Flavisolibacter sp.]